MRDAREAFATFERSKYGSDWSGAPAYPFWAGRSLYTEILNYGNNQSPTRAQLQLLHELLNYPHNIRPAVESALFEHYQKDIYDSVWEVGELGEEEELTPKLTTSAQIWDLLGEPTVRIDEQDEEEAAGPVRFRLTYIGCPWDEEHGFGIQIENWQVDHFGGEVD